MSPGKVLLLSCIAMLHVSFTASVELNILRENLRKINPPCRDLWCVETNYTREMFPKQAPSGLNILAKGITMGKTTKEIKTSICAISKYLSNHMETIVNDTLESPMKKEILDDIKMFAREFEAAAGVHRVQCHITSLEPDDFKKKELGCQILSSVRQWVEHFSNKSCNPAQCEV